MSTVPSYPDKSLNSTPKDILPLHNSASKHESSPKFVATGERSNNRPPTAIRKARRWSTPRICENYAHDKNTPRVVAALLPAVNKLIVGLTRQIKNLQQQTKSPRPLPDHPPKIDIFLALVRAPVVSAWGSSKPIRNNPCL